MQTVAPHADLGEVFSAHHCGGVAAEPFRRTRVESALLSAFDPVDDVTAAGAPGSVDCGGGE